MPDNASNRIEKALRDAFVALAEGTGYLISVMPASTPAAQQNHASICAKWHAARQQIEEALAAPASNPAPVHVVHRPPPRQAELFNDSEL
jgi:hypothetical protein